jgi:hypothetical protein
VRTKEEANAIADALLRPGIERRKKSRVRFPELNAFPIEQRDDALRAALRAARSGWQMLAALAGMISLGALAVAAAFIHSSLAVSLICVTSLAGFGVFRFRDARARKRLSLMQRADHILR